MSAALIRQAAGRALDCNRRYGLVVICALSFIGCVADSHAPRDSSLVIEAICCDDQLQPNNIHDEVDFGTIPVGVIISRPLKIINAGRRPVIISEFHKEGSWSDESHEFRLSAKPTTLDPDEATNIKIVFSALAEMSGQAMAVLIVDARSPTAAPNLMDSRRIGIRGRSKRASYLEILSNPLDFGLVPIGASRIRDLNLTNRLPFSVEITVRRNSHGEPLILTEGAGAFELLNVVTSTGAVVLHVGDHLQRSLGRDESGSIQMKYTPENAFGDRGLLTIANCLDALCEYTVELRGQGAP